MRVNLVIQPGDVCEVQLPSGDTLISGGPKVAQMFKYYRASGPVEDIGGGWRSIPYDVDPYKAEGALGTALQKEAASGGRGEAAG